MRFSFYNAEKISVVQICFFFGANDTDLYTVMFIAMMKSSTSAHVVRLFTFTVKEHVEMGCNVEDMNDAEIEYKHDVLYMAAHELKVALSYFIQKVRDEMDAPGKADNISSVEVLGDQDPAEDMLDKMLDNLHGMAKILVMIIYKFTSL